MAKIQVPRKLMSKMSNRTNIHYPRTRLRRCRKSANLRRLVAETALSPADFVYPLFVLEDGKPTEPVASMPGISRHSIDTLLVEVSKGLLLGIPARNSASCTTSSAIPGSRHNQAAYRYISACITVTTWSKRLLRATSALLLFIRDDRPPGKIITAKWLFL